MEESFAAQTEESFASLLYINFTETDGLADNVGFELRACTQGTGILELSKRWYIES